MSLAVTLREQWAANQASRRQRVGIGGACANHARAQDPFGRLARSRIDDMSISTAIDDRELRARAARTERRITQPYARDRPDTARRHDIDRPAAPTAADRQDAAPPCRQQRVMHSRITKKSGNAIQRVALADRAEIQLNAGFEKFHR